MAFRKSSPSASEHWGKGHRFEHWYRDNTIYFITARVRGKQHAFMSEEAKTVFWEKSEQYEKEFGFQPIITSLLSNHYHKLGYLKVGEKLPQMMQKIHGSIAKLVNDLLDVRIVPFWIDSGRQNYFDGCIRDELQLRRAYQYVLTQCRRHSVCADPKDYVHTRVGRELEYAVKRAHELRVFLEDVPYKRYEG
jgi:hypothetical protein